MEHVQRHNTVCDKCFELKLDNVSCKKTSNLYDIFKFLYNIYLVKLFQIYVYVYLVALYFLRHEKWLLSSDITRVLLQWHAVGGEFHRINTYRSKGCNKHQFRHVPSLCLMCTQYYFTKLLNKSLHVSLQLVFEI